ncbi:MAG: DUF4097 family beta strand repeat protein [Woeseia sp.]|nr:DUF4097 domain-containing protein [Woeseia sp.]MBT8097002.1 DUF4097 domain-containing protein [Woeseia sp.]NNE59729.1 DUF4097 family beta strand repeat protein [Woeseia sp.]NNL54754.1 DUF4097 family beta strand repeat protein [Woeseia sp.]
MKALALFTLCLFGLAANADEVRRVVDASPNGLVKIINTAGNIEVSGWSRDSVEVVAELGKNVEELIVERDDDEVIVKVKLPKRQKHDRGSSSDLVINVPQRSMLKIASVSADISVNDVLGAQKVQSVSGDIEIIAFAADIDAESVSGDVVIAGDGSRLRTRATAVSGDVELSDLGGDVEAGTVTGDLTIVSGSFDRVEMNTTNGDMVFKGALQDAGRLEIETVNGDVDIDFADKPSARFDIETFNGDIDNCFGPDDERVNRYGPGRQLIFTEGSGEGRVVIRTLNGDLRMCVD